LAQASQFTNCRQKDGEDFVILGAELERLSRLTYLECSHESQDKIACAKFISALPSDFVKRTLQLVDIILLKTAIQRAMAVKVIQENNAFRIEEGQREKFKFRAEKGFEKNNLERSKVVHSDRLASFYERRE